MDLTTRLTGELPVILMVAVALTVIVSAWLLWLYRRATLRGMADEAGVVEPPTQGSDWVDVTPTPRAPLTITSQLGGMLSSSVAVAESTYRRTVRLLWGVAAIYAAGGLVYVLILTVPWLVTAEGGFTVVRFLWLLVVYAWPTVLAVNLMAATGRGKVLGISGGYVLLVMVVAGIALPLLSV